MISHNNNKKNIFLLPITGLFHLVSNHQTLATNIDYVAFTKSSNQCFDEIRDNLRWPIDMGGSSSSEELCRAESVFGPIISTFLKPGEYMLTKTMTFKAFKDDAMVRAIYDGRIIGNIQGEENYEGQPMNTLILEHRFPDEERCPGSFYSIYGNIIYNDEYNHSVNDTIKANESLAFAGVCHKGVNRILKYQVRLRNEEKPCDVQRRDCEKIALGGTAVHPYITRPVIEHTKDYQLKRRNIEADGDDLMVSVSTPCLETDISEYHIKCNGGGNSSGSKAHYLHLMSMKKTRDISVPYLQPETHPFSPRALKRWKMNVVVPSSWFLLSSPSECCSIEIEDLSGSVVSETFCGPNSSVVAGRNLRKREEKNV